MDSIDTLGLKVASGELTHDEMMKQLNSMFLEEDGKYSGSGASQLITNKFVLSLGHDFFSEFQKFDDLCLEFWKMIAHSERSDPKVKKLLSELSRSAAKLHTMLQEELISIRDANN